MAVSQTPVFAQNVRSVQAVALAAKTTYNDITNGVLLATVGANGGFLRGLRARPRATVTATQLTLYVTKATDTGNTSPFLIDSQLMGAYAMAQTTQVPVTDFGYAATAVRKFEAGDKIFVAIGVALGSGIVFEGELEEF